MKVDPDKIDKIAERLKSVVENCGTSVLSMFLGVDEVKELVELHGGAVMAPVSAIALVKGVKIERTVTIIVPIESKVAALDDDRSQWSLAMIGRKRAQTKKEEGDGPDEEKRNDMYLTSLKNRDVPDLEKLEVYSPWWSNLEHSIKRAERALKKLSESKRQAPEDKLRKDMSVILCKLESNLNSFWISRSVRSGLVKALPLDDSNSLRCLELERQVTMASKVKTNGRVRLPHERHKYRLCPFHTPESEKIGLQLFMAATAHRGKDGKGVYSAEDGEEQSLFSVAVGMVPYPHHSDGPRLMMGGKNLKQAEQNIEGGEPSLVPGYVEGARGKKIEALDGHLDETGRFKPYLGVNALVAVMPWRGFTYEDGLVVSRSFAEKLKMKPKKQPTGKIYELKDEMLSKAGVKEFSELIEKIEEQVRDLAGKKKKTYIFDKPLPLPGYLAGEKSPFYPWFAPGILVGVSVKSVRDRKRKDSLKSKVEIVYEFDIVRPLRIGDKITGRNGNKGVVTKIEEDDAMPKVVLKGPDGEERLETVDLIISPCSIVGRKNLGQILEMGHGLALKARDWGLIDDEVKSDDLYRGEDWRNTVLPILKKLGLSGENDKGSGFPVRYREGDQEKEVRAFCGYQYISRLVHHVDKKLQARGTDGPSNDFIGQPTSGGVKAGQRLGEMENWAILSRGPLCDGSKNSDGHALNLLSSLRNSGEMQGDRQTRTMDALEKLLWLAGLKSKKKEHGLVWERSLSGEDRESSLSGRIAQFMLSSEDTDKDNMKELKKLFDKRYDNFKKRMGKKHKNLEEAPRDRDLRNFPTWEDVKKFSGNPMVVTFMDRETSTKSSKIVDLIALCLKNKKISGKMSVQWRNCAIDNMKMALGSAEDGEPVHTVLETLQGLVVAKENENEMPCSPMALSLCTVKALDGEWGIPFDRYTLTKQETLGNCYRALMAELGKVTGNNSISFDRAYSILTTLEKYWQTLSSCIKGKKGILRGHILGHRTDHSGRAVIVSRPELALDEVRLPVQMAVELLKGHYGLEILGLEGKLKDLRKKAHSGDAARVKEAAETINAALKEKGPLWCLLIRQPSLHRHSIQAFKWTVWEEQAMAIPSMVTEGFNADFDGDTMAVYLPQDPWINDLGGFTLKATPGRIGDGKLMIASGLDLALGWSALDRETKKKYLGFCYPREDVEEKTKDYATPLGTLINAMVKNDKDNRWEHLKDLQQKICAASTGCCSFSPDELDDLFVELKENREEAHSLEKTEDYDPQEITQQELGRLKAKYQKCEKTTEKVISTWLETHSNSHLSRMVRSKAKGSYSDLRHMCGFIGLQDIYSKTSEELVPSGEKVKNKPIIYKHIHESWIPGCFWTGLSDDELFVYSYASRDSMGDKKLATAQAGYLSRLLAEGLYDTLTESDDCKSEGRMEIYVQAVDKDKRRLSINYTFPVGHRLKPKGGYLWESPETFPGEDVGSALESVLLGRWCYRIGKKSDERIDLVDFDKLIFAKDLDRLKDISETINIGQGPVLIASCASPITCTLSGRGVCSRCVGADIGRVGDGPVPLGMPVGLNAAMGIGERGTQLAMKRFHDVGSGVEGDPIKNLRQILVTGTRLASDLEGGQKEDGASPQKRRPRRALSERYRDLLDKVLTDPGSGDEERSNRFGELPQRLVLFELALRAPKGLSSWASDCKDRALAAMAYERIDDIILKGGSESILGLKAQVMLNRKREKGDPQNGCEEPKERTDS